MLPQTNGVCPLQSHAIGSLHFVLRKLWWELQKGYQGYKDLLFKWKYEIMGVFEALLLRITGWLHRSQGLAPKPEPSGSTNRHSAVSQPVTFSWSTISSWALSLDGKTHIQRILSARLSAISKQSKQTRFCRWYPTEAKQSLSKTSPLCGRASDMKQTRVSYRLHTEQLHLALNRNSVSNTSTDNSTATLPFLLIRLLMGLCST